MSGWDGWTEVRDEDSPWRRAELEADARDWENEKARDRQISLETNQEVNDAVQAVHEVSAGNTQTEAASPDPDRSAVAGGGGGGVGVTGEG